jgi:hypothetical protein
MSKYEERQPLPELVDDAWEKVYFAASGVREGLAEAWKRPVRHNEKIERLALWHTVTLTQLCQDAMTVDGPIRLPLRIGDCAPKSRYEIEAAIRMVPSLVPFLDDDLRLLRADTGFAFEAWGEDMAKREPNLVREWHGWLWRGDRAWYQEVEHGDVSVLFIAASRLVENVAAVLNRNHRGS